MNERPIGPRDPRPTERDGPGRTGVVRRRHKRHLREHAIFSPNWLDDLDEALEDFERAVDAAERSLYRR